MEGKKLNRGNYSKKFVSSSTVAMYNLAFSSGKRTNADRGGFKQTIPLRKFFPRLSSLILPFYHSYLAILRQRNERKEKKRRKGEKGKE